MYAQVLVQYQVKSLNKTFTYIIPDNLKDEIKVGMKVRVPFGNKKINGIVLEINDEASFDDVKEIDCIVNKEAVLNDELIALGKYMEDKTLCTLMSAYETIFPSFLKIKKENKNYEKNKEYLILNKNSDEIKAFILENKRAPKQNEILSKLLNGEKVLKSELTKASLDKLMILDLVKIEKERVYRLEKRYASSNKNILTKEQQEVYDEVVKNLNTNITYLLHGITGSGKTEVYMSLCEKVISLGKTIIMLVPEISLTTQIIERFYKRFGDNVAIFHSELSDGEKYDEYEKIINGEVSLVVGTRSAIFMPIKNLGMIIIDEEHSSSYKQDKNPRYHALDMASFRAKYNNVPLMLGSATPSLETMARAKKGVYHYLKLDKRVGDAKLPKIKLVDMKREYQKGNMILSEDLMCEIEKTIKRKEQVMLLLNKRGFSKIVTCASCGFTYKCPNCDITLTYHKTSNHLRCHFCGYTTFMSDICPECQKKEIKAYGLGTQKVEEYLKELYPSSNIVRMDIDTTSKKGAHAKIIKGIEKGEYDIVIGTQMISKGLDFPKVTLVGIINGDESLNIPDFRSGENTFNLLTQVSGRAGRDKYEGQVLIQTFNPDNRTLNFVLNNNYLANYEYEMNIRKTLKYPPYYYLIGIKVASNDYNAASNESLKVAEYLKEHISLESICLGPTVAQNFKLNNVYRFQIIIKYRYDDKLKEALKELNELYALHKKVYLEIDVDPLRI